MPFQTTRRKVAWRIIPLMFVLYIVAYLDRSNAAWAKLSMERDLKFGESVFGWAFAIFYVGYLLLEIPGAILVERWSARKWFARILISWGICSMGLAFVRTPTQFYVMRFLLGLSEAGFFPGVIVYMTHWFPKAERARAFAGLIIAVPLSQALGAGISGWILEQNVFGLMGWQWVFLTEGAPAVLMGIAVPFIMTDRPRDARWLTTEERDWLENTLEQERLERGAIGHLSIGQVLRRPAVWLLALAIFATNTGGITLSFWLPTAVKNILADLGRDASTTSVLIWVGVVYVFGVAGVWLSGRSSDWFQERKWHVAAGMSLTGVFLALSLLPGLPWPALFALLCAMGFFAVSWASPFWSLPALVLPPAVAAASTGFINMWANASGGLGNTIVGQMKEHGFSDVQFLLFLAACYVIGGGIIALLRVPKSRPASI